MKYHMLDKKKLTIKASFLQPASKINYTDQKYMHNTIVDFYKSIQQREETTSSCQGGNIINQCPEVKDHEIHLKSKSNYKDDTKR